MEPESDPSYIEWIRLKSLTSSQSGSELAAAASALIDNLYERLTSLQAVYDSAVRDFDSKVHRLEQISQNHQQAAQEAINDSTLSKSQINTLQEELNSSRSKLTAMMNKNMELEEQLEVATRQREESEARWRDQLPLQERRASQIASQTENMKYLKDQLNSVADEKLQIATELQTTHRNLLSTQYELSLCRSENESLKQQLDSVHNEMKEKFANWREEKSGLVKNLNDAEQKLANTQDEAASHQAQNIHFSKTLEEKDKLIKRLQSQLDSLQIGPKLGVDNLRSEKMAQLADLYKSKYEEYEVQCNKLRAALHTKTEEYQVKKEESDRLKTENSALEKCVEQLQIQVANLTEGLPDNLILSKEKLFNLICQFVDEDLIKFGTSNKPLEKSSQSDNHTMVINDEEGEPETEGSPIEATKHDEHIHIEDDEDTPLSGFPFSPNQSRLSRQAKISNHLPLSKESATNTVTPEALIKILQKVSENPNVHALIALQQKYEIATSQLTKQRAENRDLEEYFVRIEEELAKSAPLNAENRRQYEQAMSELQTTKNELIQSAQSIQQKDNELEGAHRKITALTEQVRNTSNQLQTLLYRNQHNNDTSNSQQVAYEDIVSLHNRNIALETANTELQMALNSSESRANEAEMKVQLMTDNFKQLETTVSSLELALAQQEQLHQLRSRKPLSQSQPGTEINLGAEFDSNGMDSQPISQNSHPSIGVTSKTAQPVEESPKYVHAMNRIDELTRNFQDVAAERDSWRDSSMRLQATLSVKESELERASNRLSTYQSTVSLNNEQIEEFRKRLARQNKLVEKYELEVEELSAAKNSAVASATLASQQSQFAKSQVSLLEEQVANYAKSLAQAREEWQVQRNQLNEQTALLQRKEAAWIETSNQSEARLAKLQSLLDASHTDAETKITSLQESLHTLRTELAENQYKLSHQIELAQIKEQSLTQLKELFEQQKIVIQALKKQSSNRPSSGFTDALGLVSEDPKSSDTSRTSESSVTLSRELAFLKKELNTRTEELRLANEHIVTLKGIVQQSETTLEKLKTQHDTLQQDTSTMVSDLESALEEAKENLQQAIANDSNSREQLEKIKSNAFESEQEVIKLRNQNSSLTEEITTLTGENETLKKDVQTLDASISSLRSNHQHYVEELAQALKDYDSIQLKCADITKERDALRVNLEAQHQATINAKAELATREQTHLSNTQLLQQRIQDSVKHVANLTAEISILKTQVNYWKSMVPGSASTFLLSANQESASENSGSEATPDTTTTTTEDATAAAGQLLQQSESKAPSLSTMNWVTREYQITLTQLSLAQQENTAQKAEIQVLKSHIEQLVQDKTHLEQTNSSFMAALSGDSTGSTTSRGVVSAQAQQVHEKLQAQAEQLNLLRESNSVLRQQKLEAEQLYRDTKQKMTNMETDNDSMRSQVSLLKHENNALKETNDRMKLQNDHWKERVQELVTKYKDIETHAKQEESITKLQQELDHCRIERNNFKEEAEAYNAALVELRNQSFSSLNKISEQDVSLKALKEENQGLQSEIEEYKEQLEEYESANETLALKVQELEKIQVENTQALPKIASSSKSASTTLRKSVDMEPDQPAVQSPQSPPQTQAVIAPPKALPALSAHAPAYVPSSTRTISHGELTEIDESVLPTPPKAPALAPPTAKKTAPPPPAPKATPKAPAATIQSLKKVASTPAAPKIPAIPPPTFQSQAATAVVNVAPPTPAQPTHSSPSVTPAVTTNPVTALNSLLDKLNQRLDSLQTQQRQLTTIESNTHQATEVSKAAAPAKLPPKPPVPSASKVPASSPAKAPAAPPKPPTAAPKAPTLKPVVTPAEPAPAEVVSQAMEVTPTIVEPSKAPGKRPFSELSTAQTSASVPKSLSKYPVPPRPPKLAASKPTTEPTPAITSSPSEESELAPPTKRPKLDNEYLPVVVESAEQVEPAAPHSPEQEMSHTEITHDESTSHEGEEPIQEEPIEEVEEEEEEEGAEAHSEVEPEHPEADTSENDKVASSPHHEPDTHEEETHQESGVEDGHEAITSPQERYEEKDAMDVDALPHVSDEEEVADRSLPEYEESPEIPKYDEGELMEADAALDSAEDEPIESEVQVDHDTEEHHEDTTETDAEGQHDVIGDIEAPELNPDEE